MTYRLVPVEPSEEMKRALATKIKTHCPEAPSYDMAHDLYETMLASAPVTQNELLEAAKEISAYFPSVLPTKGVIPNDLIVKLRLAIRNAEQGGRG